MVRELFTTPWMALKKPPPAVPMQMMWVCSVRSPLHLCAPRARRGWPALRLREKGDWRSVSATSGAPCVMTPGTFLQLTSPANSRECLVSQFYEQCIVRPLP